MLRPDELAARVRYVIRVGTGRDIAHKIPKEAKNGI